MKSYREIIENTASKETKKLKPLMESAIPSYSVDEKVFQAKSIKKYLIVFVDIVDSTSKLQSMKQDFQEITRFFGIFHEKCIGAFREIISKDFKFKMMGDGLLFFVPINTTVGELFTSVNHYEKKCNIFHDEISNSLPIRTIAGYGKLVEFDVGLDNSWTDYYGAEINNIVHASKDIEGEFKWVEN